MKKLLLTSTFLLLFSNIAFAEESKINIILNTAKENLFSSWFSSGKEFEAFISSEEEVKNVSIKNNLYDVFQVDNVYMILSKDIDKNEIDKHLSKINLAKNIYMFDGDINKFIIDPEKNNNEIIELAYQRYKMFFPFTKSKILEKKLYEINLKNNKIGYFLTPKDYDPKKLANFFNEGLNWEKKLVLSFNTKVRDKKYDLIMISNDPLNSLKLQQTLKDTINNFPIQNTLKISFGNIFSTSKNSKNREFEVNNLKENSPNVILPNHRELLLSDSELEEINKIAPIVATNIKAKEKSLFQPYITTMVNGKNIAILGAIDDYYPKAKGIVDKVSKIQFEDIETALNNTLKEVLNESKIDMVIVLTNITSSTQKLELVKDLVSDNINKYPQKQLILFYLNEESDYITRAKEFEKNNHYEDPQLYIISSLPQGIYSVSLDINNNYVSNMKTNARKINQNTILNETFLKINKEIFSKSEEFNPSSSDNTILIPDKRLLSQYADKKDLKLVFDENEFIYTKKEKSLLSGNILIEKYSPEVVIIRDNYGNADTLGNISKSFFKEWLKTEDEKIIQLNLLGKDLKTLNKLNNDINLFGSKGIVKIIGIDFDKNIIRGRNINDNEYYKIITTDKIYNNLLLDSVFSKSISLDKKNDDLQQIIFNYLEEIAQKYDLKKDSISEDYYSSLANLFQDKSKTMSGKWNFSMKNFDVYYNKSQIYNNDKYTAVKDSRITAPNNYDIGFSGKLASLFDNKDFSFGTSLFGNLNQSFIDIKENGILKTINKKSKDDINLSLDLQLKFVSVDFKDSKISLVPYLNSTYSTEFFPTKNPDTNIDNPRRSEINNSTGFVFYPSFINEFRIGFISRYDLTKPKEFLLNPGIFSSLNASYTLFDRIGLDFDGNYRYYFPVANELLDQVSSYGELNTKISLPLIDRLKVSFNINTFMFRGNLELRNQDFGFGINGNVGVNYSFDTKPWYWIFY